MSEFRPVDQCFEKSDTIRAQHELWEDFLQERTDLGKGNQTYKFAFYVFLNENKIGATYGKDEKGNIGYGLRFIS